MSKKYNADGSLSSKFVKTYDSKGNLTAQDDYSAGSSLSLSMKWIYTYDSKGTETGQDCYAHGVGGYDRRVVSTCDSKGNETTQAEYQLVTKFGKTYWEPTGTTYRTIEYYQ